MFKRIKARWNRFWEKEERELNNWIGSKYREA